MRRMWTMGLAMCALGTGAAPAAAQSGRSMEPERARAEAVVRAMEAELAELRAVDLAHVKVELSARVAETARVSALASGLRTEALALATSETAKVRQELDMLRSVLRSEQVALRGRQPRLRGMQPRVEVIAPEGWLPQDPADSLYRAARGQLNDRRYSDAARIFASLRSDYPRSGYVGDAHYFEAFARSRVGGQGQLRAALSLLETQRREYPQAATVADARALSVRIESELARRGDAQAAESLMGAARGSGQQGQSGGQVACDEEEQSMRVTALSALLQMDPQRARPILQEVLRSRDECSAELRAQAIFVLANQGGDDPATVDLLLDLALRDPDPDPEVREAAVFWLSQTDREEAVDALIEILRSGTADGDVAEQAVFALGQTGNPRALQTLRDFAADESADAELREGAIFWLGQQGGEAASGFLRSIFSSLDDVELKESVLFSIAQSPTPDAMDWLMERALDPREDIEIRKNALFWAGQVGLEPSQALEVYRSAPDVELREQAIFVLTQIGNDGEAADALMDIARTEDDPELRKTAVFWLGQSDDPRVAEFLMELIRGGGA